MELKRRAEEKAARRFILFGAKVGGDEFSFLDRVRVGARDW
jgi:hypothetical protein